MFTSNGLQISNKSNKRLLRYRTFILSMLCRIASVTLYLSENEAKNLQNGDVHLAQIPDFGTEASDGSFFAFFMLFPMSLTFVRLEFSFKS